MSALVHLSLAGVIRRTEKNKEMKNGMPWEENPAIQKAQWSLHLILLVLLTIIAIVVGFWSGTWMGVWLVAGVWIGVIAAWAIAGVLMVSAVTLLSWIRIKIFRNDKKEK